MADEDSYVTQKVGEAFARTMLVGSAYPSPAPAMVEAVTIRHEEPRMYRVILTNGLVLTGRLDGVERVIRRPA